MRPLVIDEGKIRQLRDSELLTGVQHFIEGTNIAFAHNNITGTTTISATGGGGGDTGGVIYIDGGSPSSGYGGIPNIDGGGI
jgi:hypothetical protein